MNKRVFRIKTFSFKFAEYLPSPKPGHLCNTKRSSGASRWRIPIAPEVVAKPKQSTCVWTRLETGGKLSTWFPPGTPVEFIEPEWFRYWFLFHCFSIINFSTFEENVQPHRLFDTINHVFLVPRIWHDSVEQIYFLVVFTILQKLVCRLSKSVFQWYEFFDKRNWCYSMRRILHFDF